MVNLEAARERVATGADELKKRVMAWPDAPDDGAVSRRPTPSLDRLRADAATRVELKSLGSVARDVGMSRKGLQRFIDGGPIRGSSRGKLFRYLVRTGVEADEHASVCASMLLALVIELPPEEQVAAVCSLVGQLRTEHEARAGKIPLWLSRLSEVVAPYAPDTRPDPEPARPHGW
jgi:hypothetical protein